jgi:hypothetical protein
VSGCCTDYERRRAFRPLAKEFLVSVVDSSCRVRGSNERRRGAVERKENEMSVTSPTMISTTDRPRRSSLRRSTLAVGFAAAAVTTTVAGAVHAAGVSLAVDGEMIPLAAFAQMTFLGAIIGGLLLAVLNRRSRAARRRFLDVAAALTVLSCVPSVVWPDDVATKVALVALHLLSAAIVVPVLARHAHD